MENLLLDKGTALVLVAHPDDETIWMGGTILAYPNIDWTIFCLCRGDDPDRAPKFRRVLKFLGAHGTISNLEDEGMMNISESIPEIKHRIKKEIRATWLTPLHPNNVNSQTKNRKNIVSELHQGRELRHRDVTGFTYIFTHGYNGEYGHPRHKGVHRALRELVDDKQLITDNLFYFSYILDEKKGFAVPENRNSIVSKFSRKIFKDKRNIIHKLYGFSKSSFEYKSCANFETFRLQGKRKL